MGSSLKKQTTKPLPEPVLGVSSRTVPGALTPHQRQSLLAFIEGTVVPKLLSASNDKRSRHDRS
jgi:hypothetical protein